MKPWAQPQGPRKTPTSIPDFAFHWLFLVPHHRISHFNPTYSVVPHSICSMCHLDNWSESCVFTAPDRTFLIARLEYFQYVFKCIPHRSTFLFSLVLRQMNKFLVAKREKKTENKKKKDKWKKKKSRVEKLQIFFVAPLGLPVAFLFYIQHSFLIGKLLCQQSSGVGFFWGAFSGALRGVKTLLHCY